MVVLGRNIIRSGLWMILSFAALAGIYVLLGAPLVAAAQVLIYIGAISVLILFAIMLTQSKSGPAKLVFHHQAWAAALAAIVFWLVILLLVDDATQWPLVAAPGPVGDHHGHRAAALQRLRAAVRGRQRAAAGGGHRRRLPGQARRRTEEPARPDRPARAGRRAPSRPADVSSRSAAAPLGGRLGDPERTSHEPLARRLPGPVRRCCSPSARSASWRAATPSPCSCPSS